MSASENKWQAIYYEFKIFGFSSDQSSTINWYWFNLAAYKMNYEIFFHRDV